jgi:multiple sugar transport system substrate-binding protein
MFALRRLFAPLLIVSALILAACDAEPTPLPEGYVAPEAAAQAAPTPDASQPVTLRMLTWTRRGFEVDYTKVVEAFEAAHPNVKVELQRTSGTYDSELVGRLEDREKRPDVFHVNPYALDDLVRRQLVLDMQPLLRMGAEMPRDYLPGLLEIGRRGESQYAVPLGWNPYYVLLNTDIFKEAGVPLPEPDWTIEQFVETAKALTDRSDPTQIVYGVGFETSSFGSDASVMSFLMSNEGARWFRDGEPRFSDAATVRGLQHMQDLYQRDKSALSDAELAQAGQPAWMLWSRGRIAMMPVVRAAVPFFTRQARHKWTVVALPRGETRVNPYFIPHMLAVHSATTQPDLALELVRVMLSNDAQAALIKNGSQMPPLLSQMSDARLMAGVPDADLARRLAANPADPAQLELIQSGNAVALLGEVLEPQLARLLSGAQSAAETGQKIDAAWKER